MITQCEVTDGSFSHNIEFHEGQVRYGEDDTNDAEHDEVNLRSDVEIVLVDSGSLQFGYRFLGLHSCVTAETDTLIL